MATYPEKEFKELQLRLGGVSLDDQYGISSPELRSIRTLEAALTKVLGESQRTYMMGLELRIELEKLGYRIAKIPKPRSS